MSGFLRPITVFRTVRSGFSQISGLPLYSNRAFGNKHFALGTPPNPDKNFYISIDNQVDTLLAQTHDHDLVLIRGPPACGKSTVAEAIIRRFSYCTPDAVGVTNDRSFSLQLKTCQLLEIQMSSKRPS